MNHSGKQIQGLFEYIKANPDAQAALTYGNDVCESMMVRKAAAAAKL
jgi:hypothetical protein